MARIIALDIIKALPQHAQNIGSSGISMMVAITSQWDSLGCKVAVCWSNSRLGDRSGLSRNSVPEVRQRLISAGWLVYLPDGRNSGHYTPKLPEFHAQKSAVECANGVQFTVQTVCEEGAMTVQFTVQTVGSSLGSYIPMPSPEPIPKPEPIGANESAQSALPAKREAKRFTPPTVDEVREYCAEGGAEIDADRFVNYYESKGWLVGKAKMANWKAAVRGWHTRDIVNGTPATRQAILADESDPTHGFKAPPEMPPRLRVVS